MQSYTAGNDATTEQLRINGISVCVIQPDLRRPEESPLDAAARVRAQMEHVQEDVDLFVLPELCPLGYSEDTFANFVRSNNVVVQDVERYMRDTARQLNTYIAFGTIGILTKNETETVRTIRHVVVDGRGEIIVTYDKMQLCNYGDCAETRFFEPGDKLAPALTIKGMRIGLLICADMRYPILSQRLTKQHGVDVILQPAAFARDLSFRTWDSFRETRAVENSVYWVAVNYAGEMFGESAVVPPWVDENNEPRKLGNDCSHMVVFLSKEVVQSVRSSMPFHRTLMQRDDW